MGSRLGDRTVPTTCRRLRERAARVRAEEIGLRTCLVQLPGPGGPDGASLGWGPVVDKALVYDQSGPHNAVAAYYEANDDFMTRGMNALPHIRVVLQLVDASWAAGQGK